MDNAVRGATLAWVSMKRWVSRQKEPASAQISSKLGSLQLKGKRRRVDTVLHKEDERIGISSLKILREFTK